MRNSPSRQPRTLPLIVLTLLALALGGCAGGPQQKTGKLEKPPEEQPPQEQPVISLTLPPSELSDQFSDAEASLGQFDWMTASVTLGSIPVEQMSRDDHVYLEYLQARIVWVRGKPAAALSMLEQIQYPGMNPALQYRVLNFRRHMLEMGGNYLASAQLGDRILRMVPISDGAALRRGVWRDLQRLPEGAVQAAIGTAADPQWQGWLQLALIADDSAGGTAAAVATWRSDNPDHPAVQDLPGGLGYLLDTPPGLDSVALMLPLSGRLASAGKAVRDGYLASYYAARAGGGARHTVLILDTDTYDSALSAYDDAVARGANLVVGPLSKQSVAELEARVDRPVPVLALNRLDRALPMAGSAVVQLSLAPEDEASRIAELAFGQGARSALILRPAGNWGDKVESALRNRWSSLGGAIASSANYTGREDYSPSIQSALDLLASEKRGRDVRSMLATNIEFTARRRQDVDVVFLLSRSGAEARSIKPLLAFHYAGGLPVYALSTIYSGIPDERDRDLDGINLVETPWLLGASPGLRVAIAAGDTGSDAYTRLNALGADAFLLQTRFNQLQAGPDVLLRGNTGLLSMDPQLRIRRELSLATFDGGALKAR